MRYKKTDAVASAFSQEGGVETIKSKNGALWRIRTSDRLVRSQVLYPAELRARKKHFNCFSKNGASWRIRTSDRLVRSQVLYPAELRTRSAEAANYKDAPILSQQRKTEIRQHVVIL